MNNRIILASISPRRTELLHSLGVEFEVIPSDAEELHDESISPETLCELNAERKAADVAKHHPGRTVLGADTLVTLDRRLFGKPRSLGEAREMLAALSGRTHRVITGVCLLAGTKKSLFNEATEVRFKPLERGVIETYISAVSVLDKAGAYGIQEHGELLVQSISGSYSNVMGLPTERLTEELESWQIPHSSRSR